MAATIGEKDARIEKLARMVFWTVAAFLLLAPLVIAQLGDGLHWDGADFLFIGLLVGFFGLVFEATMRWSRSWTYRFAVGLAFAAACLIVLANGAVGMIGNEDNPYNLYFLGVIVLALAGAAAARLRPAGMAIAMALAGLAQVALALGGLAQDGRGAVFSAALAGLWLLSAALFNALRNEGSRSG